MTRRERALKNTEERSKKAKIKIINAATGLMQNEYKKKNGTWNITKLAKDLKMSRNTVTKYIKE